jgi:sulfur-carrier protein
MNVRVLYFASLRDATGQPSEQLDFAGTAADLFEHLQRRYSLAWSMQKLRVSVNGEFAEWSRALSHGDEVAFLPPMSGG